MTVIPKKSVLRLWITRTLRFLLPLTASMAVITCSIIPHCLKHCSPVLKRLQAPLTIQRYKKLLKDGYPEEVCAAAVDYAKGYHYVDDLRYAATYLRSHSAFRLL